MNDVVEQSQDAVELCSVCQTRVCDEVLLYTVGGRALLTQKVLCFHCSKEVVDDALSKILTAASTAADVNDAGPSVVPSQDTHEKAPLLEQEDDDKHPNETAKWKQSPVLRMHTLFEGTSVKASFYSQFRAVFLKNCSAMWQQRKANKAFVFLVAVMVLIIYLMSGTVPLESCVYIVDRDQTASPIGMSGKCSAKTLEGMLFDRNVSPVWTQNYNDCWNAKYPKYV